MELSQICMIITYPNLPLGHIHRIKFGWLTWLMTPPSIKVTHDWRKNGASQEVPRYVTLQHLSLNKKTGHQWRILYNIFSWILRFYLPNDWLPDHAHIHLPKSWPNMPKSIEFVISPGLVRSNSTRPDPARPGWNPAKLDPWITLP